MKKKIIILISLITIASTSSIFSENLYFSTRTTFANAQFWEIQNRKSNEDESRRAFSNLLMGSIGLQFEMEIFDMTKKRGSRIYFKGGIDLNFSGFSYTGAYNNYSGSSNIYALDLNGGAFYTGIDWDIFIGGSFPKTDLLWGFGCIFNFSFPTYAPNSDINTIYFAEKFAFFAVPSILIAYDFFIPNTLFKITPQIRTGFTCNPFIPDDLIRDTTLVSNSDNAFIPASINRAGTNLSGIYVDISVAFSFYTIKWR